jgi:hypothetical protein
MRTLLFGFLLLAIAAFTSCQLPKAKLVITYQKTKADSDGKPYLPMAYEAVFDGTGSLDYFSARIDVQCCDGKWHTLPAGDYGTQHWCTPGTYKAVLTIKDESGNTDTDEGEVVVK